MTHTKFYIYSNFTPIKKTNDKHTDEWNGKWIIQHPYKYISENLHMRLSLFFRVVYDTRININTPSILNIKEFLYR